MIENSIEAFQYSPIIHELFFPKKFSQKNSSSHLTSKTPRVPPGLEMILMPSSRFLAMPLEMKMMSSKIKRTFSNKTTNLREVSGVPSPKAKISKTPRMGSRSSMTLQAEKVCKRFYGRV